MQLRTDFEHIDSWRLTKRILRLFWPYKAKIAVAFVAMGVVALCDVGIAWLVKSVLDDVFVHPTEKALLVVPLTFFGLIAFKCVFRFQQTYLMNATGLHVLEGLRNSLYAKIVRLPMRFFDESQVGMLMSRILNDVLEIRQSLPSVVMFIREILTIGGLIGLAFYRDPGLAAFAVLVLPLAIYPFFHFGKKLRKLGRKNQSKISDINALLQESFSGIKVIKAFANEHRETGRFREENNRLVGIAIRQILNSELSSRVMEMVGGIGGALVIWYGGRKVMLGQLTPGDFFSFLTALGMLYEPIKKMNEANMSIQRALAGAERVFDIMDSPEILVEQGGAVEFVPPFAELNIRDLTFTYATGSRPALDGVSLDVRAGERVAIVGPSGSGKTTLVNLLPRFHPVPPGTILLNGRPIEDYTLQSLRLSMGLVSQDTFLFNATVRENIAYSEGAYTDEQVEQAARAAYAHDFILELPEGYATVVGERGVKLSGGQKQRLTIARALLMNPPLLILDEATSALDTESERIVQLALENLMRDRTSIVIAHRLSTILSSDRIVVMEQGRILAQGRHRELLESCPLYARLYRMQFAEEGHEAAATPPAAA